MPSSSQRPNPPTIHIEFPPSAFDSGSPRTLPFDSGIYAVSPKGGPKLLDRNNTTGHSLPPPSFMIRGGNNSQDTSASPSSSCSSLLPSSSTSTSWSDSFSAASTSFSGVAPSKSLPQITITRPLSTVPPPVLPSNSRHNIALDLYGTTMVSDNKPLPALPSRCSSDIADLPSPTTSHTLSSLHARVRRSRLSTVFGVTTPPPMPSPLTRNVRNGRGPESSSVPVPRGCAHTQVHTTHALQSSAKALPTRLPSASEKRTPQVQGPQTTQQLAKSVSRYLKMMDKEMDREFKRLRDHVAEVKDAMEKLREEREGRARIQTQKDVELAQRKMEEEMSRRRSFSKVEEDKVKKPPRIPTMVFPVV